MALNPLPDIASDISGFGITLSSLALLTIACPKGCSDPASAMAANLSNSFSPIPDSEMS
jgi:hypothetical protein